MNRQAATCLSAAMLFVSLAVPARAQHLGPSDISDSEAYAFLRQLKFAVRRNDTARLWALTAGNLLVDWPDSEERITSGAHFAARYHAVFTDSIRQQILRQLPESLFVTPRGVVLINYGTVVLGTSGSRVVMVVVTEPGWTGAFRRPLPKLDVNFMPRGRWWPTTFGCAGDWCGGVDPEDSIRLWRDGLMLAPESVTLGADTCRTPVYVTSRVLGDAFLDDWKFRPHELDLNDSLVTQVEIGCPTDWYGPHGQLLLVQDSTRMWVLLRGPGRFLRVTSVRSTHRSGPSRGSLRPN